MSIYQWTPAQMISFCFVLWQSFMKHNLASIPYGAEAGFELLILRPLLSKYWNDNLVPPSPALDSNLLLFQVV